MKGFGRALLGELYLWSSKRSVRWAMLAVALFAAGTVAWGRILVELRSGLGAGAPGEGAWNFWPQFAGAARAAMFLVELLTLILLGAALPREIALGAARDPLVRRISRSALVAARACVGLLLPLLLAACAIASAAGTAALLFDAGDVIESGDVLMPQDELAPIVKAAVLHGLPPLLALAGLALWLSTCFRQAVVAVGAGLMLALAPRFLHQPLGDTARWLFPDTLAGLGADSYLEKATLFSQGYGDALPMTFDAVVGAGWIAPWPALGVAWLAAVLCFLRRPV